jgi:hypothetical protein
LGERDQSLGGLAERDTRLRRLVKLTSCAGKELAAAPHERGGEVTAGRRPRGRLRHRREQHASAEPSGQRASDPGHRPATRSLVDAREHRSIDCPLD